jgi:hypothetical protein
MLRKRIGAPDPGVELSVHVHDDGRVIATIQAYSPGTDSLVFPAEDQQVTGDQIVWAAPSRTGRFSEMRSVERGIVVAVLKQETTGTPEFIPFANRSRETVPDLLFNLFEEPNCGRRDGGLNAEQVKGSGVEPEHRVSCNRVGRKLLQTSDAGTQSYP